MPSPFDYSINVPDPTQAFLKSFQGGVDIQDAQLKQQQQQQALAQQQQQQQYLQSFLAKPDKTADDYAQATLAIPGMREQFKQSWDMKNADQQRSSLQHIGEVASALTLGKNDVAIKLLNDRADALQNSGADPKEVQSARTMAQLIQTNPTMATGLVQAKLGALGDEGGKVLSNLKGFATLPSDVRKGNADASTAESGATIKAVEAANAPESTAISNAKGRAEVRDINSQIGDRAARLALSRDELLSKYQDAREERLLKYGQTPESITKQMDDASLASISADQSASQMTNLAAKIEAAGMNSGGTAKLGEWWKKTFGSQDELTRIRSEYNRIVTPAAMAAYKKNASGSTSDKDIETAMTGVPPDTADPATMAAFLRGAAKLQVYESVLNNAKAEWWGENKHLGKTKTDIEISGVQVPAGTTFRQFVDKGMLNAAINEKLQAKGAETVPTRSYMRHANPGAQ